MTTLAELAGRLGGEICGDPDVEIRAVASLTSAGPQDIAYVASKQYYDALACTGAGAVILTREDAERYSRTCWLVDNPRLCFARVAALLNVRPKFTPGVHRTALVDARAKVAPSTFVGAHAVVETGATIAAHVFIGPGCYIGPQAVIGAGSWLGAQVFVAEGCTIGRNCVIHPGAVIGSDGFGFVRDRAEWVKIPQLGCVRIGNDVEIGANTTIDRGALDDTVIGDGVKLDNLIQIAHNVHIGNHTAMAAMVGVAGSTHIGERCTVAGQAGISEHLRIVDDAHITAASSVTSSISEPGTYSSSLRAEPATKWNRKIARLSQLDNMAKRLRRLEEQLQRLLEATQR